MILDTPIIGRMLQIPDSSHIIVQGVGLIGGSVAAAVKQRCAATRVTGIGRNQKRLLAAQNSGLIDDWAHAISDISVESDAIVVVCLPVDLIPQAVLDAAAATPLGVLLTDAGSVKQSIQAQINRSPQAAERFVGAHPIAGSEQNGHEFADADLFVDKACIVTSGHINEELTNRCCQFWKRLGASVTKLTTQEHDRALALTSHLPHIMAAVTADCVQQSDSEYVGSGFLDTTRVAAGDAQLWQQILCGNRTQVVQAIAQANDRLDRLATALQNEDDQSVTEFLEQAARIRRAL